jgi:hypothetical protein
MYYYGTPEYGIVTANTERKTTLIAMTAETLSHRPEPPFWEDMVSHAQELLDHDEEQRRQNDEADRTSVHGPSPVHGPSAEASREMIIDANECDDNELDSHLYYGHSLGLAYLSKGLQSPAVYATAIDRLADKFAMFGLNAHNLFQSASLSDLWPYVEKASYVTFHGATRVTFAKMTQAERLTTDALAVTTMTRRAASPDNELSVGTTAPTFLVQEQVAAASMSSRIMLHGPIEILRRATRAKQARDLQATEAEILGQELLLRAGQAMQLHAEELADGALMNELFPPSVNGDLRFDLARYSSLPELPADVYKKTNIRHDERLICPAYDFNDLALVHSVMDIVWAAAHKVE